MFDAPVDSMYVWVGLAVASTTICGLVTGFPTTPPPDAAGVADTVDRVAASPHSSTAEHPLVADAVRVGPRRVELRDDGATAHATFAYGPVTPVAPETPLRAVLRGSPPGQVFDSPTQFRQAVAAARSERRSWRSADGELTVRSLSWEGVDVTLVER